MPAVDAALLISLVVLEIGWLRVLLWCARRVNRDRSAPVATAAVAFLMFLPLCASLMVVDVPAQPIVVANQAAAFAVCAVCWLAIWKGPRGPRGV